MKIIHKTYAIAAGASLLLASACQSEEDTVMFTDDNLKQTLAEKLETGDDAIKTSEAEDVESLDLADADIETIEGLEAFTSLAELNLAENRIESFEPLLELDQLTSLHAGDIFFTGESAEDDPVTSELETLEDNGVDVRTRPRLSFPEHEGPSEGIFYEVSHEGQTMYLFGSIHVGDERIYPLQDNIEEAFSEADSLAVEINIDDFDESEASEQMAAAGMNPDNESLEELVSEETYLEIQEHLTDFGIPEMSINQFEPWFISLLLNDIARTETPFTGEEGIDQYFIDQANDNDIPIESLETLEDQIAFMSSSPLDEQISSLKATLESLPIYEEELEQMLRLWRSGDNEIFKQMRSFDDEHGQEAMDSRDENMSTVLAEKLESENDDTHFVVVGALHLVSENGIPALLEDKGYDVTER
ncbi:TraB/GumN family protein [Salisediminibacterium halotolerans]|uniref:TraB/GumN family protein n=1 Tax=Salisediminibacterium halotolerans TaxID=517425 RepID=UPI000EAE9961|nr:TraB/GumN family protein [Salisediminibacterium halotolerans]RLJ69298.1 hypothetical protein BCL39_2793 [Actinophytocola xinjiangensis]RPE86967.1 hypothetical protein EDD67_1831 [Salisediminibacterium halotolerans]TWG32300.1 hypothetical protein BCL52_2788 [Salisediminibacterium halotolerans]GEL08805.1 hypothetical protein SHA02_22210 [Salisediminibacterium halotolerans]